MPSPREPQRTLLLNTTPIQHTYREKMIYQKTTQNAIAAMSRLAELYADTARTVSSREIAESRNLPAPLVAKILTVLSRSGLVIGSPGPGGGYRLARPPSKISLKEVTILFERETEGLCAYGPGWCGNGPTCPLHNAVQSMREVFDNFLERTTFAAFEQTSLKSSKRKSSK